MDCKVHGLFCGTGRPGRGAAATVYVGGIGRRVRTLDHSRWPVRYMRRRRKSMGMDPEVERGQAGELRVGKRPYVEEPHPATPPN